MDDLSLLANNKTRIALLGLPEAVVRLYLSISIHFGENASFKIDEKTHSGTGDFFVLHTSDCKTAKDFRPTILFSHNEALQDAADGITPGGILITDFLPEEPGTSGTNFYRRLTYDRDFVKNAGSQPLINTTFGEFFVGHLPDETFPFLEGLLHLSQHTGFTEEEVLEVLSAI